VNGLTLNAEPAGTRNSYWMVTAILDPSLGLDKFAMMAEFDKRNIDSRPFFSRLSSLPAFAERSNSKRFVRENDRGAMISQFGINLPSGYNLRESDVDIVCRALRESLDARA
jgi:perosamine synthetase